MTTRITAKYRADDALLRTVTKSLTFDVDDQTGRLIGLGLLFDADCCPGDAAVEIEVEREPREPVHDPLGSKQLWANVRAAKEAAAKAALGPCPPLDAIVNAAGDIGVRALASAANVPEDQVRRAIGEARQQRERFATEVEEHGKTIERLHTTEAQLEDTLRLLGWDGAKCGRLGKGAAELAAELLGEKWVKKIAVDDLGRRCAHLDMALRSVLWRLDDKAEMPVEIVGSVEGKVRAYVLAEDLLAKNWVRREHLDLMELARARLCDDFDLRSGLRKSDIYFVADAACVKYRSLQAAAQHGIAGAVADVRAFHAAAMEGNPHALLHERTEAPALVRAVSRYKLLREEYEEYVEAGMEGDVVGVLDALIDVIYVAIGTGLIQFGGDRFSRAWKAVHESNMRKRWPDGRFHIREDGKIIKPDGWVGPDIAAIVGLAECESDVEAFDVHAGDKCLVEGEWRTIRTARTNADNYREVSFWGSGEIRRWHPGEALRVKRSG